MVGNMGLEPTSLSTPVSKTGAVTISPIPHIMVGREGLEPSKSFDDDFTGHLVCRYGNDPNFLWRHVRELNP